jgi:16S rRNA (cytosine1402-N4)-methyltransferase
MDLPETGHDPVLLDEVIDFLRLQSGQTVVDCTLGRGGHSLEIANRLGLSGTLIAMDADPRNLDYTRDRLKSAPCRVRLLHANFTYI